MGRNAKRLGRSCRPTTLVCLLIALGCGSGGTDPIIPDPTVEPFVGDWEATEMLVTNVANPQVVADVLATGATFDLNVQPSGHYRATLVFQQQPLVEQGQLTASGSSLTLDRTFPQPPETSVSTYSFSGPDVLILDGPTEFDFNLDGTPEAADSHIELRRVN